VRISDALEGIQQLYIEATPLISYVEEHPQYVAKMDVIIQVIEDRPIEAVSSVITLTEVLTHPVKLGNIRLEREYRDILLHSGEFRLLTITAQIAESAAALRARYHLRTPDALHVAAAIDVRCDALLTNDTGIKRVTEITVLVLDELELDLEEA
jgi:predicted nucleic acid-binding protein